MPFEFDINDFFWRIIIMYEIKKINSIHLQVFFILSLVFLLLKDRLKIFQSLIVLKSLT